MQQDSLEKQFELMTDRELVRAITLDRDDYTEDFYDAVLAELTTRRINLATFVDKAQAGLNKLGDQTLPIEKALALVNKEIRPWDTWFFTNCLNDVLVLQKEYFGYTGYHIIDNDYQNSFFIESNEAAEKILRLFLKLEAWQEEIEYPFLVQEWEILEDSQAFNYVVSLVQELAQQGIPATIFSPHLSRYHVITGQEYVESSIKILVPPEYIEDGHDAVKELQQTINRLYQQAEELEGSGDSQKELEVFTQLAQLAPDDEHVFYNLGVILFNLGKFKEAANAFTEAAINKSDNIEIRENSIEYLTDILVKLPNDAEILHTLATMATIDGDAGRAIDYNNRILAKNQSDPQAHLNLGYLYYQDSLNDRKALEHFNQYLELNPEALDREEIEAMIAELG